MRRIGLLLVAALAVAAVVATPGVAAKKFHKFNPKSGVSVSYTLNDSTWTCFVMHKTDGKNPGNDTSGGYDLEFCDEIPGSVGYVPGTYSGNPTGAFPPFGSFGWFSDWPALNGEQASSWTVTISDNGDGTVALEAIAYYPIIP